MSGSARGVSRGLRSARAAVLCAVLMCVAAASIAPARVDAKNEKRHKKKGMKSQHDFEVFFNATYDELYRKLHTIPVVLSKSALVKRVIFECGGTRCVTFASMKKMQMKLTSQQKEVLYGALPDNPPALQYIAEEIANDSCFELTRKLGKRSEVCPIKVNYPKTAFIKTPKAKRCAVVGNSGLLAEQYHGDAIDASDVVIRFNLAATKGYERHVGSKTSIRIYNSDFRTPQEPGEIVISQVRKNNRLRPWIKGARRKPRNLSFMFDPSFLCHVWEWISKRGNKPSTGMNGVMLGLRLCDHVDLYGFHYAEYFAGAKKNGGSAENKKAIRPHYYEDKQPPKAATVHHPFILEKDLYKMLERRGVLTLH